MAKQLSEISTKRTAINKASAQMVAIVAAASFVTVFCLVASKAVLAQNQYNARVTQAKEKARDQQEANLETFSQLQKAYVAFNDTATNIIGGNTQGTGDNDGNNSKIILDALPSNYDFPALTSSLEKIFKSQNVKVNSITGTDDQVSQQNNSSSSSPQIVEIPFTFTIENASYQSVTKLMDALQRSIRPIQVDKLEITGSTNNLTVTVDAHTFFQPAVSLKSKTEVVK